MALFDVQSASTNLSHQMGFGSKSPRLAIQAPPVDVNISNVAFTLGSRDRGMNTRLIATDLLKSYLSNGGCIKTNVLARSIDKNQVTATNSVGEAITFRARHIILATGKNSHLFSDEIRVFASPLLIVRPALTDINFINMSPHSEQTLSHTYHEYEGGDYSVIGNASYQDAQTATAELMRRATTRLFGLTRKILPNLEQAKAAVFYGYHTDLAQSPSCRQAHYYIKDYSNYTLALPGNFSLCFSLAAKVCGHFGIEPVSRTRMLNDIVVEQLIEPPRHVQAAKRLAIEAEKEQPRTLESARRSRERNVPAVGY